MEPAYFNACQFLQWLNRIHIEKNREQQGELFIKLSDYLYQIFHIWCDITNPNLLYKVIEILSPCVENNLYSSIISQESLNFMHPFPFSMLPKYVQNILATRKLDQIPKFYLMYDIIFDKQIIILPTPQFFLFTFMAQSCRTRQTEWFDCMSFLEFIYGDPFLLLYSQYLTNLDSEMLTYLVTLTEEYIIKDSGMKAAPAPSRHCCEMLLLMIYVLQKPQHLLLPSFRMVSINEDALLFSVKESLYMFFKNMCLKWQEGPSSYCSFVGEVWLQYITPWRRSQVLEDYFTSDCIPAPAKGKDKGEKGYTGEEQFWEEYVEKSLLFYTEIFGLMGKLLCSDILFRQGDIDLLVRFSMAYAQDMEGYILNGNLNLGQLKQWTKVGQLPQKIEEMIVKAGVNRNTLYPFDDATVVTTFENIVHKASSLGYPEFYDIKKNLGSLLGLRERSNEIQFMRNEIKINPNFSRSLLNVWEKPLRSDELSILYLISRTIAYFIDRLRNVDKWPPETNLRFFASYTNLGFVLLLIYALSFIIF